MLVSTRSRGRVWLRSSDPRDKPRILTNTLAERDDVDSLVAGVKLSREMAASAPLADTVVRELQPGAELDSDADIEASVRQPRGAALPPGGHLRHGRRARMRCSTPICACAGSKGCAWWTPR